MANAEKKCRACGNSYKACRSAKKESDVFVWQEVACSAECGRVYLEQITASRMPTVPISEPVVKPPKGRRKQTSIASEQITEIQVAPETTDRLSADVEGDGAVGTDTDWE